MFLAFLFVFMGVAESPVVVASLARVEDQVVTTRDLQINLFLNEIENPLSDYLEKKEALKELVYEHLIVKEAQALMTTKVADQELKNNEEKVQKRLKNDNLWKTLKVDSKELSQHLERKYLVKQLLLIKMPKDIMTIPESAIQSYYLQNRNQLGQRPLDEVREQIEKGLKVLKNRERFKDWMTAVTRTYSVVYYSGYNIK